MAKGETALQGLNGQPRTVLVQDKARAPRGKAHRKADETDPGQIGAPMPGMIVGVGVQPGAKAG